MPGYIVVERVVVTDSPLTPATRQEGLASSPSTFLGVRL